MPLELAVIILNWNAGSDTLQCIRRLSSWHNVRPKIWVVDNHSTEDSADGVAAEFPQVNLIRNNSNLGYAGGNNRALADILQQDYEPVLFLNNDAVVGESDLYRLMDKLKTNPQIGIIGPVLFDAEQPDRLLTAGGQNPVLHLSSHISELKGDKSLHVVDYIPGTVMLVRVDVFRSIGLLDESYFFSGEMPDLCHRAKQHGYLSAVDPSARAYHEVGRSSAYRRTLYVYYIIRNRFLFIRKFYKKSRWLLVGFWTVYSLALLMKMRVLGQADSAEAVRLGLLDGLRGHFGGRNERVLAACNAPPAAQLQTDMTQPQS